MNPVRISFKNFLTYFKDNVKEYEWQSPILYNQVENGILIRFMMVYDFYCYITWEELLAFYNIDNIQQAFEMFESEFLLTKGVKVDYLQLGEWLK